MIDALQQVVSQLEQLSPEEQANFVEEVQPLLLEHQRRETKRILVYQMSEDEFAAFLAERQVSKPYLAPDYRGIYYSDEEFEEALDNQFGQEEVELNEHEDSAPDANI